MPPVFTHSGLGLWHHAGPICACRVPMFTAGRHLFARACALILSVFIIQKYYTTPSRPCAIFSACTSFIAQCPAPPVRLLWPFPGCKKNMCAKKPAEHWFHGLFHGGERGIRTLGAFMGHTRFPVVRLRPAQPSFHNSILHEFVHVVRVTGLEPVRRNTRPSNVPVCQFQHTRIFTLRFTTLILIYFVL